MATCYQCPKPALFRLKEGNIPLCLDCYAKLTAIQSKEQEYAERVFNMVADLANAGPGGELAPVPKFPGRIPKVTFHSGEMTTNHIRIEKSNVGVLNTGTIHSLDNAIGCLKNEGGSKTAEAFKCIAEKTTEAHGLDTDSRNKILEFLSVLSSEAVAPKDHRKKGPMLTLLRELGNLCKKAKDLHDLYQQYAPLLFDLFK